MEEYKTLIEVVSDLIEKGYLIDFSPMENILRGFQKAETFNVPPEDFLIDQIYCCEDENDEMATTFVFAISSKKYKFKGIVINALTNEDSVTVLGTISKIKNQFLKVLKIIKCKVNRKSAVS